MQTFTDQDVFSLLRKHHTYVTRNRVAVLKVLSEQNRSISLAAIRKLAPVKLDRISVYRTLQLFRKKGIVVVIPNSKGIPLYILTAFVHASSKQGNKRQNSYFVCSNCGYTEQLELHQLSDHKQLVHHYIQNSYIVLEGLCKECKK